MPLSAVTGAGITCFFGCRLGHRKNEALVDDELGKPEDDAHHEEADADDSKVEAAPGRHESGDGTCREARSDNTGDRGAPVQHDLTADARASCFFPDPVAAHEVRRD